ncbi:TetR family transcriptional regulator [Glycomyces sp. NPDC046736]|uniref:TetR/AcrR family transcriptional regulator n=1 Tax=Glycomyces sp. NPDC046736 TaxID=3155615 RepID=UPI0033EB4BC7
MDAKPEGRGKGRRLRCDAEANRDRIIEAARRLYGSEGLSASMAAIARAAGVGIATLFRRFPVRSDLVAAVFADAMEANRDAAAAALEAPSAWDGFRGYVIAVCGLQAENRGFAEVLTMTSFGSAKELERHRQEAVDAFGVLIERAKDEGRLRKDFSPEDLPILLMANAGVLTAAGEAGPESSRRFVGQMLRAYAVDSAEELEPAPPSRRLLRGMIRQRRTGA